MPDDRTRTTAPDPFATATGPADPPGTARHPPADASGVPGYAVEEEVGRGGMGVVYRARQVALNRAVALKMLAGADPADGRGLVRFLAEAEAAAAVRHPHVVQVYDFGQHGGRPFLALEYLPGGTLADRLKAGPPSPGDAAALVAAVARGVAAAHGLGIVHRDLKPANVLFDAAGEPKVTDFGLAKRGAGSDLTHTGAVFGTPAYMAPEQAKGNAKLAGPPADVWALGVILYECLTGKRPFTGDDHWPLLQRVLHDDPAPPRKLNPAVPRDLELVCLKCLAKEPHERYPTAAELADDLEKFLAGESVSVRPAGVVERAAKWARRKPTLAAAYALAGVSLALAGFGAGLGALWRQAEHQRRDAEQARQREEEARAGERAARLQAYEGSIRLALQQGAFADAVGLIDRAPEAGLTVPPDIRVGKVRALIALGRDPEALAEVRDLAAGPLPPGLLGPVELLHGTLLFGEDDAAGAELVRSALARDLPPADREYARGVLAESSADAVEAFRAAIARDRLNQRAHAAAAALLLLLGRADEALTLTAEARDRFPGHPDFLALSAIGSALRGDEKAAARWLAELRPRAPAGQYDQAFALAQLGPALTSEFRAGLGEPVPSRGLQVRLLMALAGRRPTPGGAVGLLGRLPPVVAATVRDLTATVTRWSVQDPRRITPESVEELRRLTRRHPEGVLLFLLGMDLMDLALPGTASDDPRYPRWCAEAADAFEQAARTPAVIDVRGAALEHAAVARALLGTGPRSGKWGPGSKEEQRKSVRLIEERIGRHPIALDRVGVIVRALRHAGEYALARVLLDDWERRAPGDLAAARERAEVEFRAEAYHPAVRAAERVLARDPKDARAKQIRDAARARVVPYEVAPPPRPAGQ